MYRGYGLLACSALVLWSAGASAQLAADTAADTNGGVAASVTADGASETTAGSDAAASAPTTRRSAQVPPWRRKQRADTETPTGTHAAGGGDAERGAGRNTAAQNSWLGSTGGLHLIDGSSGEIGTLRLQFGFDYFSASDLLEIGDSDDALSGVLSLSATPIKQLEVFAALSSHSNSNTLGVPVLLQVAGDVTLGAKGYKQLLPWLSLGADARLLFLNTVGDLGVLFSGTSLGVRGAATADLRYLQEPVPLILRANLGYLLDNSSALIEAVERGRYAALPSATRRDLASEDRHLVTRIERFALGVNRVDMFSIGLGVEAPLAVATDFYIHPLLEWQIGIPVNRQGYSCLSVSTDAGISGQDGCLAITGLSAAPSTLTLGARVLPPVRGLSGLVALDIGLLGTSTFVRELAPNRPWAFILAVAYAVDTRPPAPVIHYVVGRAKTSAAAPSLTKKRIRGQVLERGFGTAVAGAVVRYPDHDVSPQVTSAEGRFTSYEFEPGEIVLEVTHPDYESARCSASIPAPAAAAKRGTSHLQPMPAAASGSKPSTGSGSDEFVEARCELVGRPKGGGVQGSLTSEKTGMPVPNVTVELTGPETRTVVSDAGGQFTLQGLKAGEYTARIDAPSYLLKSQPFTLTPGSDTTLPIVLIGKPKTAQVTMTAHEVKIRTQIMFKSNSADIDERSTGLLTEIADVLQRNPQATQVQVQGHTDNRGDSAQNLALSQNRAEAVVQWLVNAGVASSRLEAKGFGDARPLVPNLTPGNRSQNRRVQFIIKDQ
jgi:OOP family OmpA-OmpF porin